MNIRPPEQTLFVVKKPTSPRPQLVATALAMAAHPPERPAEMPSRTKSGIFFARFKRAVSTSAASKVQASGTSSISSRPTTPTTPASGSAKDGFGPLRRSESTSSAASLGLGGGAAASDPNTAKPARPGTSAGRFGFGRKSQPPTTPVGAETHEAGASPAPEPRQSSSEPAKAPGAEPQPSERAPPEAARATEAPETGETSEMATVNGAAPDAGGETSAEEGAAHGDGQAPGPIQPNGGRQPAPPVEPATEARGELSPEPSREHQAPPAAPAAARVATGEAVETRASPPADADTIITYHSDADLYLVLRNQPLGQTTAYGVCSAVISAASPAWRRLLRETGTPVPDAIINFFHPHNTPVGLDILLSIAHYKFHGLPGPTGMPLDPLYQLSLAAARYEALHLLVPFVRAWLAGVSPGPGPIPAPAPGLHAPQGVEADKLLVLSWVFGCGAWFARVAPEAVWNASLSHDGQLVDAGGRLWKEQPVSEAVLELLANARLRFLAEVVTAVSTPVQKLLNPQWYPDQDVRFCRAPDEAGREDCEQLQVGSALMGLTKAKLWPAPDPARVKASPAALARAYNEVRIRRYRSPALRFAQPGEDDDVVDDHARCGFGHREAFDATRAGPVAPDATIVAEMKMHASACGTWAPDMFAGLGGDDADADADAHAGAEAERAGDALRADVDHGKQTALKDSRAAAAPETADKSAVADARAASESLPQNPQRLADLPAEPGAAGAEETAASVTDDARPAQA